MATIEIVSDRMPWVNGKPHEIGAIVECSDEDAALMIERGFAVMHEQETATEETPKRGRPRKVEE